MSCFCENFHLKNLTCFAAGFAIISSILITIRQLSPIVGENIIIMGLTIATFLIAIYFGYNSHKNSNKTPVTNTLQKNFLIIASIFGIGLSYVFVELFNLIIITVKPNISVFFILFNFLLIIIAPIAYFFGKSKIFINNASMVGILAGSIVTPMLLMRFVGIATTVFIIFLLFILISLEETIRETSKYQKHTNFNKNFNKKINLLYLLIIPICYYLNITIEKKFFTVTNAYGNYKIIHGVNNKIFSINQSPSSMIQQDTKQGFSYIELIKKILFNDLGFINKNILVLGAGGFSFTADGNKDNTITYVDIDPDLKNIVIEHFSKNIYGDFKVADAAVFVKNAKHNKQKYSAVISDVYSTKHVIPSHILSAEYLEDIRFILEDNGVAIFNIIAKPGLNDSYSCDIDRKIRMIFPKCMAIPLNYYADKVSNIIYVCASTQFPK